MKANTGVISLFILLCVAMSTHAQCTAGTLNGVTTTCHTIYSRKSSPLVGEPTLNYDLYYPESAGPNNNLPIVIFWHGGGYRSLVDKESSGQAVFAAIALPGYNVYIPDYTLAALGILNGNLCGTCGLIPIKQDDGDYFPTAVGQGYYVRIDSETIGPIYQQNTIPGGWDIWAKRSGPPHNSGAFVYVVGTQWPHMGNDAARFFAYLGANAGKGTGVPGNPTDIRLWGFSAGGHLASMQTLTGSSLFVNDGEFTIEDFENAVIRYATLMSPASDWSCTAMLGGLEPNTAAAFTGGIPLATITNTSDCAHKNPNFYYTLARSESPVNYVTDADPRIPVLLESGYADSIVPEGAQAEYMAKAPDNVTWTLYDGEGHTLDLYLDGKMNPSSQAVQAMENFMLP